MGKYHEGVSDERNCSVMAFSAEVPVVLRDRFPVHMIVMSPVVFRWVPVLP